MSGGGVREYGGGGEQRDVAQVAMLEDGSGSFVYIIVAIMKLTAVEKCR